MFHYILKPEKKMNIIYIPIIINSSFFDNTNNYI